jgi:lysyl-tRNA synthetase class I
MTTQTDWELLVINSPYQTAQTIRQLLQEEKLVEATTGLDILIESMGRSERRAVKSQLIRLMSHVIKWKCQPEKRSASWTTTIRNARMEIEDSQAEYPSLNRTFIESIWDQGLKIAIRNAEDEMGKKAETNSLSWQEVFEEEYRLL